MPSGVHNNHVGTGPKRNARQREIDYTELVKGIRRGISQVEMARRLGVTKGQISQDWKRILRELRESRKQDAEDIESQILAQYDGIKQEAFQAWDKANGRMLEEIVQQVLDQIEVAQESDKPIPTEFTIKVRSNPPVEYLNTAAKMVDRQAELQGVKEPDGGGNNNVNVNVINWEVMTIRKERPDPVAAAIAAVAEGKPLPIGFKELPTQAQTSQSQPEQCPPS